MGIMGQDYAFLPKLDDQEVIRAFQGAGLSHSAGVGRISYMFGFEGPSVAVDTASSSSLVAVMQAVRSLQDGNCNLALAGGVNAILAPVNSLLMSKAGLLAPDGRCKSFSAAANGFGRGEGCGVVVLKRLGDAQRDGDRIMAVVRGGAVVHNGTSGGITSPSSKAQARVIQAALMDAKVAPSRVQYLEAHGTGTEYGDPMELGAAASIYGKGRKREEALLVGSVKANISHLEAAGGASGLIKTVLALHHGMIPPQIHLDEPSPHIPWKRMPLSLVREATPWPAAEERLAGVTALGLVGTNAHVIVASSPSVPDEPTPEPRPERERQLLTISARSEAALGELVADYETFFRQPVHEELWADAAFTAGVGRRHYEHRVALVIDSAADACSKLTQLRKEHAASPQDNGTSADHRDLLQVERGHSTRRPRVAWAFPEQLPSDARGILQRLTRSESVVQDTLDEFAERLTAHHQVDGNAELCLQTWLKGDVDIAPQVASYLVQACLARLLSSWGLEPDVVVGWGSGQIAAYAAAGGMCFGDGLLLVVEQAARTARPDADWDRFESLADEFNYYPPHLPMVCTMTGELVPVHRSLGGSFWRAFGEQNAPSNSGMSCLWKENPEVLLVVGEELAGDPTGAIAADLSGASETLTAISLLRAGESPLEALLAAVAKLYVSGVTPCFRGHFAGQARRRLSLPTYPFQGKRYWITEIAAHQDAGSHRDAVQTG